ncbi:MAG TPA: GNAT family N-acetyltransferase [Gammaproteobacteria bacterium]|nr:GNAT family N-acetyltransferase [Gammaproteobacteria bacterium]
MLSLNRHPDARAFLLRTEQWLTTREIEHAGVLQSARQARGNDSHYERPMYWTTIEDDGRLIGCAYRTPPYKVGVTALPEAALAPLIADLAATYSGAIGGFSGPDPTVTELARAWVRQRGGSWSVNTGGRLLSFGSPGSAGESGAAGVLRLAAAGDSARAQSWGSAASIDSGIAALDGRLCLQLLGAKMLYFWEDDQPRCMLGLLRETPDSVAVGIVYTPAAFRGEGHATAAIRALSRLLDERGVKNRYLWIDPKSDAANALAAKLGCGFVYDSLDIDCT